jgi:DNA invertase Pin-like site-specific DNA recombinase
MKKLRCAIYSRKSTDEGLDQTFNSLDAQREACAAYILSQAGEGWTPLKDIYDDGGFSGGSMERPALKRLMSEVESGRVDVIVVYKVDRLTRSLADFARIVEVLDRAGASFVSVTQAFNTTTSMGRLTLNVLLSFAQFEREVTGERIRDKIAASKAKGMWMGGNPPLGYDIRDRALHVNEAEAETVRAIFQRYLDVRSVYDLRDALNAEGFRSKAWVSGSGRSYGGTVFTHGALYHILANRIYVGDIVHKGRAYHGAHDAIIAADLFDRVQQKLKAGTPPRPGLKSKGREPMLLGKLFDDLGTPMTSAHANKQDRRYFYYVSTAVTTRKRTGSLPRVSAPKLERTLAELVAPHLDRHWLAAAPKGVFSAIQRAELGAKKLVIEIDPEALAPRSADEGGDATSVRLEFEHTLARPAAGRLVLDNDQRASPRVDRSMVRAIVQARRWQDLLASGEVVSIEALAQQEKISPVYLGQLLPFAYLAPDLIETILDGRQPSRLSLIGLIKSNLPMRWAEQRTLFSRFH